MLRQVAEDLYCVDRPQRFGGLEIGTRMSAIRLESGELWLHSPVVLDPALRSALDKLGPVRFVVAPNRFHHLYAGDVKSAYPEARLFLAPGLEHKRPDLDFDTVLGDEAPVDWKGQLDQLFFRGFPFANEIAFCHRASRTLIATDLVFNLGPESPALTRLGFRLLGAYDRFGPTLIEHLLIRDRKAAARSMEQILAWDFDRVVLAHGRILESGGRDAMRESYAWLL